MGLRQRRHSHGARSGHCQVSAAAHVVHALRRVGVRWPADPAPDVVPPPRRRRGLQARGRPVPRRRVHPRPRHQRERGPAGEGGRLPARRQLVRLLGPDGRGAGRWQARVRGAAPRARARLRPQWPRPLQEDAAPAERGRHGQRPVQHLRLRPGGEGARVPRRRRQPRLPAGRVRLRRASLQGLGAALAAGPGPPGPPRHGAAARAVPGGTEEGRADRPRGAAAAAPGRARGARVRRGRPGGDQDRAGRWRHLRRDREEADGPPRGALVTRAHVLTGTAIAEFRGGLAGRDDFPRNICWQGEHSLARTRD
mmetsp:Transcript_28935/g.81621  ORF Transcript_28935/g.81621 Transcript_28935/m.81621 type:complete len:310 (+) Transcript_28935:788-1717(+)